MIFIDIYIVVQQLIPPVVVSDAVIDFINCITKPLRTIQSKLYVKSHELKYSLSFNGQVIYLEHILNDLFDPVLRRIFITNQPLSSYQYIYNYEEGHDPIFIFNESEDLPFFINNRVEFQTGFIVHVPTGLVGEYESFKYYLNMYKLKSKEYQIIEY